MKRAPWLAAALALAVSGCGGERARLVGQLRFPGEIPRFLIEWQRSESRYKDARHESDPDVWRRIYEDSTRLQATAEEVAAHLDEDLGRLATVESGADRPLIEAVRAQGAAFSAALRETMASRNRAIGRVWADRLSKPSTVSAGKFPEFDAYGAVADRLVYRGATLTAAADRLRSPLEFPFPHDIFYRFGFLYSAAAGFYLGLACLLFSPGLRQRFQEVFRLPTPVNQAVIEPFDAVRGLAALWVALFHADLLAQLNVIPPLGHALRSGPMAVSVFAALSAFLIFRSLRTLSSAADLRAYLKRRWLRIYPLYFATTVAILVGGYCAGELVGIGWKRVAADFLMLRLFGYPQFFNPPAWSLYVEEGFYLLVPLWVVLCRKRAALGALATYLVLSCLTGVFPSREFDLLRYFCVGILLTRAIDVSLEWEPARWGVLGVAVALFLAAVRGGLPAWCGQHLFPAAILLGLWSVVHVGPVHRALSRAPLRFLGVISYSVYLIHYVVLTTGMPMLIDGNLRGFPLGQMRLSSEEFWALYPAAIVFCSAVSYALIERPFLLLRRRDAAAPAAPAPEKEKPAGSRRASTRAGGASGIRTRE